MRSVYLDPGLFNVYPRLDDIELLRIQDIFGVYDSLTESIADPIWEQAEEEVFPRSVKHSDFP